MILGIGTDIVNIERVEKGLAEFGERYEHRLFTPQEIALAAKRAEASPRIKAGTLAKRIAAKEAFVKALGTGFTGGISWQDMEIVNNLNGLPVMNVTGAALVVLRSLSPNEMMPRIDLSMADDYPVAQAFVIISVG